MRKRHFDNLFCKELQWYIEESLVAQKQQCEPCCLRLWLMVSSTMVSFLHTDEARVRSLP